MVRSTDRPDMTIAVYPWTLSNRTTTTAARNKTPGPGCSKLTTSLVNVSLKFQTLIYEMCHYFLLKKCEKLLHCKSFSHFFNKKFQYIWF